MKKIDTSFAYPYQFAFYTKLKIYDIIWMRLMMFSHRRAWKNTYFKRLKSMLENKQIKID